MKCEDCKYFEPITDCDGNDDVVGECRRNTPLLRAFVLSDNDKYKLGKDAIWPEVLTDDWCGEFEAKIDVIPLPTCIDSSLVRRFLRNRKREDRAIETVSQFLALSEYDVLSTKHAGETTLADIACLQKKLRNGESISDSSEKAADAAVREVLGIKD